jgi:hypothetical protein
MLLSPLVYSSNLRMQATRSSETSVEFVASLSHMTRNVQFSFSFIGVHNIPRYLCVLNASTSNEQ